jgi:hypothetical protein
LYFLVASIVRPADIFGLIYATVGIAIVQPWLFGYLSRKLPSMMLICITLILLIVRIVVIVIPKEAFTNNNINDACSDQFKWSKLIGLHR